MALSFKLSVALLLAVLAAAAADGCQKNKKITVQNLCGHDLPLTLTRLANSDPIFGDNTNVHVLRHGTHAEFPVCWWTGRLDAPGAPQTEFHLGVDGGAWYMAPNAQPGQAVPVTVTPHTARGALQGHCPAVGCPRHGVCFQHAVPGGNCHNVDEIKIIYCSP